MHRPSTPQGTSNVPPTILGRAPSVEQPKIASRLTVTNDEKNYLLPSLVAMITGGLFYVWLLLNGTVSFSSSITVVAGIAGAIVAMMILARPQWGAYMLAMMIPLNLSRLLDTRGYPNILTPLIVLVGVALFFHLLLDFQAERKVFHLKKTELVLICVALLEGISIYFAEDQQIVNESLFNSVKNFGVLFAIVFAIRTPAHWKRMMWCFILGVTLPSVLAVGLSAVSTLTTAFFGIVSGIYQEVDGVYRLRFGGPIRRPNYYAMLLASALPLLIFRTIDDKAKWIKGATVLASLFLLAGIMLTYSRGAILSLGFMTMLILFAKRINIIWMIAILILGIGTFWLFAPDGYTTRITSLSGLWNTAVLEEGDGSIQGRISEYTAGYLMFRDYPLLGVGKGNYPRNYLEYAKRGGFSVHETERDAHSLYVEKLAEGGLLGFSAMVIVILVCGAALERARRRIISVAEHRQMASWLRALQISLGVYLFASLFLHDAFIRFLWLYVAFAISATHVTTRIWERRSIERPFSLN